MNTTKLVIEKGIPVSRPDNVSDQLRAMEVGDSVLVTPKEAAYINSRFYSLGFKSISRKINENEVRIWKGEARQ